MNTYNKLPVNKGAALRGIDWELIRHQLRTLTRRFRNFILAIKVFGPWPLASSSPKPWSSIPHATSVWFERIGGSLSSSNALQKVTGARAFSNLYGTSMFEKGSIYTSQSGYFKTSCNSETQLLHSEPTVIEKAFDVPCFARSIGKRAAAVREEQRGVSLLHPQLCNMDKLFPQSKSKVVFEVEVIVKGLENLPYLSGLYFVKWSMRKSLAKGFTERQT